MSHQENTGSRIQFMNYLNIFACFAVICLHCSQAVFYPEASITWCYSVVMQSVFIFAVPIFFMISRANLLAYRKRYTTKVFFKKRFRKTFGALLFGSVLVYCITCFCPELFNRTPGTFSIVDFIVRFCNNEIEIIYWFFYVILVLYIFTPILTPLADSKKRLLYTIAVLAFITSILPMINRCIPLLSFIQDLFGAQALTGGLMYFLLGYYLQNYADMRRPLTYVSVFTLCTILMTAATFIINIDALEQPGIPYEGFFANAFSLFAIGSSISVFMLFSTFEPRFQQLSLRTKNRAQRLSSASLGVYLIHLLVMDNIAYWLPHPWSVTMTIEPFFVYAVSVSLVMLAQALWASTKKATRRIRPPQFR